MKTLITITLAAALTAPVGADTLKAGFPACESKALYEELTTAADRGDERALEHLLENGCIVVGKDMPASLLEASIWLGAVRVRVYDDEGSIEVWVPYKALAQE